MRDINKVHVGNRTDLIFNLMIDLGFSSEELAFLCGTIQGQLGLYENEPNHNHQQSEDAKGEDEDGVTYQTSVSGEDTGYKTSDTKSTKEKVKHEVHKNYEV